MPEFDRLRSGSIYANAVHEAGKNTNPAVPSLLTGRTVLRARELGPARLGLTFEGSPRELDLAETSHLFGRAWALGFSSGVAGWGIPYCRLFGAELDHCWWCESVRYDNSIRPGLATATLDGLRSLLETMNFSPFGQSICLRQHITNIADLTRESIELAVNDDVDLALIHLHGAHPPHVYDRQKLDFSLANSPIRGYSDSLALCDLTLGRIRSAMEQRGLWDRTTVLVASDHHSRSSQMFDGKTDQLSIFILKMAGQDRGSVFGRPISAVVTGDLILEILRGNVKNADDARAWLISQRTSERM
jgi:Sulfatase